MSASGASNSKRSLSWLSLGAVALLAVIAYAGVLDHPFVYDDVSLVLKNPKIRSLEHVPEIIGFGSDGFRPETRWTREVSHAIEYAIVGPNPRLYHATNIALHAIIACLVLVVLTRISRDPTIGFWAAALFAVHPLNTEVVTHISGRRGLLAALFSLMALMFLLGYSRRGSWWRLAAGCVSLYLAVFSKELAIMTVGAFVLADLYERGTEAGTGRSSLRQLVAQRGALYGGLAAFSVLLGASILLLSGDVGLAGSPGFYDTFAGGLSVVDRARLAGTGLRLFFVPLGQSVDYSFDALGLKSNGISGLGILDLLVVVGLAAVAVRGLVRRDWSGFAAGWVVIFYLPHLGIIPWHEVFAERFMYLPAIGLAGLVAAWGVSLSRSIGPRPLAAAGLVAVIALTAGTVARNQVWSGRIPLWQSAVERYPGCARAHKALADALLVDSRAEEALEHYERARTILPVYHDAHLGVAVAQTALFRYDRALRTLEGALEEWPTSARVLNAKAYVHQTLGDDAKALLTYSRAIEENPSFAEGYNNLAMFHAQRGDLEQAVSLYEQALEYNPALIPALQNLATVYREGYEDEERAAYYEGRLKQLGFNPALYR